MKSHVWKLLAVAILCSGTAAQAQIPFGGLGGYGRGGFGGGGFGGGGTIQGSYLQGLGAAGFGLGYYNQATAQANSINVDTVMRWNDYVERVTEYQTAKYFTHMRRIYRKQREFWKQIQERIDTNPDENDLLTGDALNKKLIQLKSPGIAPSAFRYSPVTLSIDMVRAIPFKLAEAGANFSVQGLAVKETKGWEIALRGDEFVRERRAYQEALKTAKAEQVDSKMSVKSIRALEEALNDFQLKLDETSATQGKDLYLDAKNQIAKLKKSVAHLSNTRIERVFADLNDYAGTTVEELKDFMQTHRLTFGIAETPEEIALYTKLFHVLKDQAEKVAQPEPPAAEEPPVR